MTGGVRPFVVEVLGEAYGFSYPSAGGEVASRRVQDCRVTVDSPFPRFCRLRVESSKVYSPGLYMFDPFGVLTVFRDELRVQKFPRLEKLG